MAPHGNSKSDRPFFPTLPSTMEMIRKRSSEGGPKEVVGTVSARLGGVMKAADACELPRDEQQVSQMKRRLKHKGRLPQAGTSYASDEIAVVMQRAHMEDSSKQFIRELKALRELAIIVAHDRQINDLVRFCTYQHEFGVLTVDPTFSLGDFDVTIISYHHLLLSCRSSFHWPCNGALQENIWNLPLFCIVFNRFTPRLSICEKFWHRW